MKAMKPTKPRRSSSMMPPTTPGSRRPCDTAVASSTAAELLRDTRTKQAMSISKAGKTNRDGSGFLLQAVAGASRHGKDSTGRSGGDW